MFETELLDPLHSLLCRDNRAGFAGLQRVSQSFVTKLHIERHNNHTGPNDSQRSRDPLRAVFRKDCEGIAGFEIVPNEAVRERAHTRRKFFKTPLLSIFPAEDDQRRLLGVFPQRVHDRLQCSRRGHSVNLGRS